MISVKWTYKNGAEYDYETSSVVEASELYGLKCQSAGVVNVKMLIDGVLVIEFTNNYEKEVKNS